MITQIRISTKLAAAGLAALLLLAACGVPFLLPQASANYALLRHMTLTAEVRVDNYYLEHSEYDPPVLQIWTPPAARVDEALYTLTNWYDHTRPQYVVFHRPESEQPHSTRLDWEANDSWLTAGESHLLDWMLYLPGHPEEWGAGVQPLSWETGMRLFTALPSWGSIATYQVLEPAFDGDDRFAGFSFLATQDVVRDNLPDVSEDSEFAGNDISHTQQGSLFVLVLDRDFGNSPPVFKEFSLALDTSDYSGFNQDFWNLSTISIPEFEAYFPRGFYATAEPQPDFPGRSYISLLNLVEAAFHTFSWTRGSTGSPEPEATASRLYAAGRPIEGRLIAVLHDGTLLFQDMEHGGWKFFREGDREVKRLSTGSLMFVQEFEDEGTWYTSLSYTSVTERRAVNYYAANYRIPTDRLLELAGY